MWPSLHQPHLLSHPRLQSQRSSLKKASCGNHFVDDAGCRNMEFHELSGSKFESWCSRVSHSDCSIHCSQFHSKILEIVPWNCLDPGSPSWYLYHIFFIKLLFLHNQPLLASVACSHDSWLIQQRHENAAHPKESDHINYLLCDVALLYVPGTPAVGVYLYGTMITCTQACSSLNWASLKAGALSYPFYIFRAQGVMSAQ